MKAERCSWVLSRLHTFSISVSDDTAGCSLMWRCSGCLATVAWSFPSPHLHCMAFCKMAAAKDAAGLAQLTNRLSLNFCWCMLERCETLLGWAEFSWKTSVGQVKLFWQKSVFNGRPYNAAGHGNVGRGWKDFSRSIQSAALILPDGH